MVRGGISKTPMQNSGKGNGKGEEPYERVVEKFLDRRNS